MHWILLGILSALVFMLWSRVKDLTQILEQRGLPNPETKVNLDHIRFESADVAAQLIDRHVQQYHKGAR